MLKRTTQVRLQTFQASMTISTDNVLNKYWATYKNPISRSTVTSYPSSKSISELPCDDDRHFRGFLIEGAMLYGAWISDWFDPPSRRGEEFSPFDGAIVCHVKPRRDRFASVPDRWDLFLLLRWYPSQLAMRTLDKAIKITRTKDSESNVRALMKWERDHPYRLSRLKKNYPNKTDFEREQLYAESAMRGIGLKWPGKPHDRIKYWPDRVRELGLSVEIVDIPIDYSKPERRSEHSFDAQIQRFLYEGVERLQNEANFLEILKDLHITPRNLFIWLKRQRKGLRKTRP